MRLVLDTEFSRTVINKCPYTYVYLLLYYKCNCQYVAEEFTIGSSGVNGGSAYTFLSNSSVSTGLGLPQFQARAGGERQGARLLTRRSHMRFSGSGSTRVLANDQQSSNQSGPLPDNQSGLVSDNHYTEAGSFGTWSSNSLSAGISGEVSEEGNVFGICSETIRETSISIHKFQKSTQVYLDTNLSYSSISNFYYCFFNKRQLLNRVAFVETHNNQFILVYMLRMHISLSLNACEAVSGGPFAPNPPVAQQNLERDRAVSVPPSLANAATLLNARLQQPFALHAVAGEPTLCRTEHPQPDAQRTQSPTQGPPDDGNGRVSTAPVVRPPAPLLPPPPAPPNLNLIPPGPPPLLFPELPTLCSIPNK